MAASNRKIEDQVRYEDGKLYWIKPRKKSLIEKECGYFSSSIGYRVMQCGDKKKLVHHVIWYLHNGVWPDPSMDIDHINMDIKDNRIENLRQVTRRVNALNNKAESVYLNGNKWRARVAQVHLGVFTNKDEAIQAAQLYKQSIISKETSYG